MKSPLENMPPLEQGETPWTAAEMQVREAMLAAEVAAPADLESKVMKALDATSAESVGGAAVKWVAAALVGSALVWAALGGEPEAPVVVSPQQEVPVVVQPASPVTALEEDQTQAEVVMPPSHGAELQKEVPVVSPESDVAMESPARMGPMEAMSGRAASMLEASSEGQLDLQHDSAQPRLERRPATLEVKQ